MDPLSVTASIVAIIGAAGTVSLSIKKLLSLRGSSDALLALNNDVADLQLVLQAIHTLLQKNSTSIQPEVGSSIRNTSNQATKCLRDLDTIIDFNSMSIGKVRGKSTFNRLRHYGRIQRIQENLRSLRAKLNTALGVLNSSASLQHEVVLQQVQVITMDVQSQQALILDQSSRIEDRGQKAIQGALSRIMESSASTQDQLAQIQRGLISQPRRRLQNNTPQIVASQASKTAAGSGPGCHTIPQVIKFSTYYQEPSTFDCRCSCHRPHRFRTPPFFDKLLGSFFLGYIGLPMTSVSCDTFDCNHQPSPTLWIDYYFPGWFVDWRVHLLMRNRRGFGPELSLRVTRVVASTAGPIKAAMQGDVQRLRSLLRDGHASPYDTDGINSPLTLAVQAQHVEICEILLHAGADPYEETGLKRSAYDYAWDIILGNQVDARNLHGLQRLFSNTDHLETRQFTLLHKVVLGLNPVNLSMIIQNMSASRINEGDAYGRSALCWAATRRDTKSTRLLLQSGANPNISPTMGHTALQSAAQSGCYASIELLLNAGAEVDYQGAARMTALHIAVATHDDVGIVRLLIQRGAEIDLISQLGSSALQFACIHGHTRVVEYLIEHGANIHQRWPSGEGILHAACWGNNPELVRLVLKKGVNYHGTTKTFGTALHAAARILDIEILKVLTEVKLEGIDIEEKFEGYTALEYATQRRYMPPEWMEVFKDLLNSIQSNGEHTKIAEIS